MNEALPVRVAETRLGVLNVFARMPFRFGAVTIHAAAQATLEVRIETRDGSGACGHAADFLSYKWFDKRPERSPQEGSADLIQSIEAAATAYKNAGFSSVFAHWRDLHRGLEQKSLNRGYNRLGANFGVSMIERAVIDAVGRMTGQSFDSLLRGPLLGIDEPSVFAGLRPGSVAAALPPDPLARLSLRHTIGLVDPIFKDDVSAEDRLDDGFPETLEDYLDCDGINYLKVKVSGDTDSDINRLRKIWAAVEKHGQPVSLTLDGNEQYASIGQFAELMQAIRARPELNAFYDAILFIEQPVERSAALDGALDRAALDIIGKPLLIDEADGWTTAFEEAVACGYSGVSHKNCKGIFRSFLNNALAAAWNDTAGQRHYFLSAEDLSDLPSVSLQSDLASVASLGITHVERNGHHYFRGLDHLSQSEQQAALQHHGDLYRQQPGTIGLNIKNGEIDISSLQVPGFGFATPPNMDRMIDVNDWSFDMLEQGE